MSHIVTEGLSYLSAWNFVLMAFPKQFPTAMTDYTSLFCGVGGFYVAWVHPRYLPVRYLNIHLDFREAVVMDLLAHQLPRYFVTRSSEATNFLMPRLLVLSYALWFGLDDIKRRYVLRLADLFLILGITEFLYYLL